MSDSIVGAIKAHNAIASIVTFYTDVLLQQHAPKVSKDDERIAVVLNQLESARVLLNRVLTCEMNETQQNSYVKQACDAIMKVQETLAK